VTDVTDATDVTAPVWSRRRMLAGTVGLVALGSVSASCRSGPSAARPATSATPATAVSHTVSAGPGRVDVAGADAELIRRRYGGLRPFAPPPPPPAVKPVTLSRAHPGIFSRVVVSDKVVFVTIDDGVEKDPAFVQMVKDFRVPITVCLADTLIKDDYAYFARLYETGYVSIQNHTLTHPLDMPRLSAARQLDEIAGQQEKLRARYGAVPRIFRPPGGTYNATTIAAVRQAGLGGVMLWKEAMQIYDMQYQAPGRRLMPGDIVLCHFRGPAQLKGKTMVQMMTNLFRHIQAQGFTVADVTAYV
jgi:peptidoglycan/xylan/chitin deacetylase (PgdA/CDA1 family)